MGVHTEGAGNGVPTRTASWDEQGRADPSDGRPAERQSHELWGRGVGTRTHTYHDYTTQVARSDR